MPEWISKTTCAKCKKKGHMAFNQKFGNKVVNSNKFAKKKESQKIESADHVTEFAGMVYHKDGYQKFYRYDMNYLFDKEKDDLLTLLLWHNRESSKRIFHCDSKKRFHMYVIINSNIKRLTYNDKMTVLWILSLMKGTKRNRSQSIIQKFSPKHYRSQICMNCQNIDPSYQNKKAKRLYSTHLKSTLALSVEHELQSRNKFAASNLEKGWIIDSSASAHMTPFKNDCKSISTTRRTIYLADGSSVQCMFVGIIKIPIHKENRIIGTLKLDDVLIVPNLDRRLFFVNAFLNKGNNWFHFDKNVIKLGINDGPTIKIPISSLQANAMVANIVKNKKK